MWGQALILICFILLVRIIPTRVGTRKKANDEIENDKDHPHACGDKLSAVIGLIDGAGSSPRVWGQGNRRSYGNNRHRIIPTRVGTSTAPSAPDGISVDHPHACGDKLCRFQNGRQKPGSSPRVWGQACFTRTTLPALRIIPTRVGTSDFVRIRFDIPYGSSPRVWGQALHRFSPPAR